MQGKPAIGVERDPVLVSAPTAPPTEDELRQQPVEQLKVELAIRNATASVPQMSPASVPPMSR